MTVEDDGELHYPITIGMESNYHFLIVCMAFEFTVVEKLFPIISELWHSSKAP
jgi:hypothetical protein